MDFDMIHLYRSPADDGGQGSPVADPEPDPQLDPGAGPDTSTGGSQAGGQPAPDPAPFWETVDETGKPVRFMSKEDLEKAWKSSGMLRSTFSRKTETLAQERRQFEQEREAHKAQIAKEREQYEKLNQFIRSRPDVYRQLESAMQKPISPEGAVDSARQYVDQKLQEINEKLAKIDELENRRSSKEKQETVYAELAGKYKDFNREEIENLLTSLEDGDMSKVAETLYWATKGQQSMVEIEKRLAKAQAAKAQGRMVPSGQSGAGAPGAYTSFDEAEQAALNDL